MRENSNDGKRKLWENKVWSANRVDFVCREYKFSLKKSSKLKKHLNF